MLLVLQEVFENLAVELVEYGVAQRGLVEVEGVGRNRVSIK